MKKDYNLEKRKYVIAGLLIVIVLIYLLRLLELQVFEDKYKANADSNAFLRKTIYPSRGLIYDRNGELIVYNQPAYDPATRTYTVQWTWVYWQEAPLGGTDHATFATRCNCQWKNCAAILPTCAIRARIQATHPTHSKRSLPIYLLRTMAAFRKSFTDSPDFLSKKEFYANITT